MSISLKCDASTYNKMLLRIPKHPPSTPDPESVLHWPITESCKRSAHPTGLNKPFILVELKQYIIRQVLKHNDKD
jgi:hypothetical protein